MLGIGIENISVFGLPIIPFVELAADLGCQHISTGLNSYDFGVCDYAPFSLRDNPALCRELNAVMRDRGISISLGEGCMVREGVDVMRYAADLDLFAELGTERINAVSMDPDFGRTCAGFARLAEMTLSRGMRITTELAPPLTINSLPRALEALQQIGNPQLRLLIDTMHVLRSGATPADVAALDPDLIDYVQLCDAAMPPCMTDYFQESMFERLPPGEGGLPLRELVAVLPRNRVYALEVPQRQLAQSGVGPHERLGHCVAAARRLLDQVTTA